MRVWICASPEAHKVSNVSRWESLAINSTVSAVRSRSVVICNISRRRIKINLQEAVPRVRSGRFLWGKILYKNLDLTQDFPNKISFHFLWEKMLPKHLPKIFRWPEMCPLGKTLAQDFQMAAFTKILGRRDKSVVPLLSTENCTT